MSGQDPLALYQRYIAGISTGRADGAPDPRATPRWRDSARLDALIESVRAGEDPSSAQVNGASLVSFLVGEGGIIDAGGELRGMDAGTVRPGLVNSSGMDLDRARDLAAEAGYFGDDRSEEHTYELQTLTRLSYD